MARNLTLYGVNQFMAHPIFFLVCKIASGYIESDFVKQNFRLWQVTML
jgi:hypothetical protein